MLVLSRQTNEKIMVGDDIEITIVNIQGRKVRIGIDAPQAIPVHRREVYDAINCVCGRPDEVAATAKTTDSRRNAAGDP